MRCRTGYVLASLHTFNSFTGPQRRVSVFLSARACVGQQTGSDTADDFASSTRQPQRPHPFPLQRCRTCMRMGGPYDILRAELHAPRTDLRLHSATAAIIQHWVNNQFNYYATDRAWAVSLACALPLRGLILVDFGLPYQAEQKHITRHQPILRSSRPYLSVEFQ